MARKSITKIAAEVGISSGEIGEVLRRVKEFCQQGTDNRVEAQGFGIFYNQTQNERWSIRDKDVFKYDSRQVVTMRPPRRRRSYKGQADRNYGVTFSISNWPDETNANTFTCRDGAHAGPQPLIPGTTVTRDITYIPQGDNGVTFQFKYERNDLSGSAAIWTGSCFIRRYGSALITEGNSFQGADNLMSQITPVSGDIRRPFGDDWRWSTSGFNWQNRNGPSVQKAAARYIMKCLRGELWPIGVL